MQPTFLFSNDCFNPRQPEAAYRDRYFVINGQSFANEGDYAPRTLRDRNIPDIVNHCAKRIKSNFFSIDVVQRKDGVLRIVEIGDGQVSDFRSCQLVDKEIYSDLAK